VSTGAQLRLFDAPEPVATKGDILRPYQREDFDSVQRCFQEHRHVLGVGFCGYGKTTLGAELAKHEPNRVLWIAGRDVLLSQARERIEIMTGEPVDIEKAQSRAGGARVVAGSVQTLKGARLKSWARDWFQLIIVDEAHHATAKSYRTILEHFNQARVFGITATPRRHDKIGMHNVFTVEAFKRDALWGMREGFLIEPIPIAEYVDSIHLENIPTEQGDLQLSGLEDEIAKNAAKIVGACYRHVEAHATLWFTPGVASAHAVAATINERVPGKAVAVDASTDSVTRRMILRDFASGSLRHVANCGIYGEGADFPHASAVVDGKPTKSEADYMQRNLRPGRPLAGIGELPTREGRLAAIAASSKPRYVMVNVTGNAGKHSLATVVQSLAGNCLKETKERAEKIIAAKSGASLVEALVLAEKELDEEENIRLKAIAAKANAARVDSRTRYFDAYRKKGVDFGPAETGQAPQWTAEPPTQDDLAWLKKNRLATKGATKGTVAKLRAQARAWLKEGRASFGQRGTLSRMKAPVDVSFVHASALITLAYQNGRGRFPLPLSQAQVDSVLKTEREPGCDDE
jgi:superfamily II DNA or RNA helicase